MTTKDGTERIINMPLPWRIFGVVSLLAIPAEIMWLWDPHSGLIGKLMVALIVMVSVIGGLELSSFRLVLGEKHISLRIWPRVDSLMSYGAISDIRIRPSRSTVVTFKSISSLSGGKTSKASKFKIPASAIKPEELSEFLNRKLIENRQ